MYLLYIFESSKKERLPEVQRGFDITEMQELARSYSEDGWYVELKQATKHGSIPVSF